MDDPVGDYIAWLAERARAMGMDPTTYRADRTARARRALNDRVAWQDQRLVAALRRRMRLDRQAADRLDRGRVRAARQTTPREKDRQINRWRRATAALTTWAGT